MTTDSENRSNWIDISVPITDSMLVWPGDPPVRVEQISNIEQGDSHNLSLLSMSSHTGTHIDAPVHFFANGLSVDKIALENLIGITRVIEISDIKSVEPEDLKPFNIRKGERILIKTCNSGLWRDRTLFNKDFVYLTVETATYLKENGVSLIGVDYLSVGNDGEEGSKVHRILLGAGITIIEGLDLSSVTPGEYDMICLPLKIQNGDGAPARAILKPR